MITLSHFSKTYGDKKAVESVSFEIKDGEIVALIGPNSSGKTTIVKSVVGLLEPTHGSVTVSGYDVVKDPENAKQTTGYIPDEPSVWSYMTGREFLKLTHALFRGDEKKRDARIKELLPLFSLEGIEDSYFDEYSRGNKQKFSILAALSHEPQNLIIDEPIVGLDPTGAEIAKKLFKEFAQKGGAVLLVTHTLPVAEEIADRIGVLSRGKLVAIGTMDELRHKAGLSKEAHLDAIYNSLA